jgi:hypothetical protein
MRTTLAMAMLLAVLTLAGGASAADIGANDDTGKFASDGGTVFFTQMSELGLKQSVMTTRFLPSDPTAIPDGDALDRTIPIAQLAGLQVALAVYPYPPREIEDGTATPTAFAAWLTLVALRYPTVKQFIVMNEPNQPAFVRPQFGPTGKNVSAARAGAFLAASYDALKAVDPAIRVIGLGLSPRGNDQPTATSNVSTSPVRFLAALGAWYRASGRTLPLMDGLSFHPYPDQAIDPIDRGYNWPKAGFPNLDRIKQSVWDAFRDTPQKTTVNGLQLYLDEVGWQVDTSSLAGYTGTENVRVTDDAAQAHVYSQLVRDAACDPQIAEVNIFGFYDDAPRDTGFQAALYHVDGTPRASAASVQTAITQSASGCLVPAKPWIPAKHVIGAVSPTWSIVARRAIRFEAAADEGANVVACLLPGNLGGIAAAALVATKTATSPGCRGGKALPQHPVSFIVHRALPLRPVTVAVRLVAETSTKRSSTFSRTLR